MLPSAERASKQPIRAPPLGKPHQIAPNVACELELKARVPGANPEAFKRATNAAKAGCAVSKLYNTNITLNAELLS